MTKFCSHGVASFIPSAHLCRSLLDFLVDNEEQVIGKVPFDDVPGRVIQDVLVATTRGEPLRKGMKRLLYAEIDALSELRRKLDELGLVADGSREAAMILYTPKSLS